VEAVVLMRATLHDARMLLRILGAIPIVAGLASVAFGGAVVPGDAGPSAESELRFYGAWWFGAGLFLQWVASDLPARRPWLLPFAGLLALGATGRLIGILVDGAPDGQFVALMVIEYAVAALLAALHRGRAPSPRA
jgi:hypothetical protein